MKPHKIAVGVVLCFGSSFAGQIHAPRPGLARYPDGYIASVYGVPGSFVLRNSSFAPADAASFSDSCGLNSSNGLILLLGQNGVVAGQYDSQEPAPLLSITGDFSTALAWLPSRRAVLYWTGKKFTSLELGDALPQGIVTSIVAAATKQAEILITQANGAVLRCLVSLANGNVVSCDLLPGVTGPAFEQQGFLVFEDGRGLEVQDQTGNIRTFAATASDLQFQRMSSGWLHLYSTRTGQHWALHLGADLSLTSLPAAHPVQESGQ